MSGAERQRGDLQGDLAPEAADFGFREVARDEKAGLVQGVFTSVASRYDLMNDVMSAGAHRLWKEMMIDWLAPRAGARLLDVAGGTGDISRRYLQRLGGMGEAVICDLTEDMLHAGRRRDAGEAPFGRIDWVCGDATELPFADQSFDYVTIAFGIRNVTDKPKALREMRRVLKFGGRFVCLEFSKLRVPIAAEIYEAYSFNAIPALGSLIAGDRDSYQYLVESIRRFPSQEDFAAMIAEAGFDQVSHRNITGGVVALHSGWRL